MKVSLFSLVMALGVGTDAAAVYAEQENQKPPELVDNNVQRNNEQTNLYWGDTHLHTSYSFDAFMSGNETIDPDAAYRWAKGLPIVHPYNRSRVQIGAPLDFLVVADHAELMGVIRAVNNDTAELADVSWWDGVKRWFAIRTLKSKIADGTAGEVFRSLLPVSAANPDGDPVADPNNKLPGGAFGDTTKIETTAWGDIVEAAERHNSPGEFTAMIGWEWSSIPTGANLHRVVITPTDASTAKQFLPYGSDNSQYPQDLWNWLQSTSEASGAEFLAIPHNSNISKGYMYPSVTLKGEKIDRAYAETRQRWEPVSEITQIKGDSETHPVLSPNDEFADFETYGFYIQQEPETEPYSPKEGDYIRSGLKRGLEIEADIGVNPYKFGVVGSTDAHGGLSAVEEDNFLGKFARDSIPENKASFGIGRTVNGWDMAAQGLAAVWAPENTREAIFSAFKRREVYGTTGPRMRVRFFAGWGFDELNEDQSNLAEVGYRQGVPMGGDLFGNGNGQAPEFLIHAVRDPATVNLERVQVVKGWLDKDGKPQEKVFNVAWSGDRQITGDGDLPTLQHTVDLETGKTANTIGEPEFILKWRDPEFNPTERAFYYVRVFEIPSARHSLLDAIALQADAYDGRPSVQQERAYTSSIWYTPQVNTTDTPGSDKAE